MTSDNAKSPDLLLDRLNRNARRYPDKTAVTFLTGGKDGGKVEHELTYKALEEETSALADRLLGSGLVKGERAVLVYPPSLDFMVAFLACLKAGVVAVPVFPPNPTRKDTMLMFSRIVEGCGAKHALTSVSYNYMKKIAGIKESLQRLKRSNATWPEQLEWIVSNDGGTKSSSKGNKGHSPVASDVAFLQYTSGSTSEPKGVMITHGNLGHNLSIITNELKATDDTVVVSWLPQYHDMGLIGSYLGVLYCGGSGYYMSPLSFLQRPMLWMEAVSKYHATHLQAPNFAFKLTSRKLNPTDYTGSAKLVLSSVRHIINAAEPVDEDSIESFYKAFGPFGLGQVIFPTYGLAEHTVFVCSGGKQRLTVSKKELEVDGKVVLAEGDSGGADTSRLIGCGYPSRQGVDVKIVNTDASEQVPEDVVGEIWIQSPSKAAGYFGKEEESKEDFHAQLSGTGVQQQNGASSGYLRTGDLGFLHNEELFICGRLKDLIIVGGRNYYPQDIEATAEAVTDSVRPGCSAAFTIDPTSQGGEEVAIVLELREVPKAKDVNEVCDAIANTIYAAILEEHSLGISKLSLLRTRTVPKTTSGKIARAWCRKGFVADTLDTVYRKSFKDTTLPLEIEQTTNTSQPKQRMSAEEIRAMDKKTLLAKLTGEVAKMASVPPDTVRTDVALATIMDSLSISQFNGQLEAEYATKLSDEYLFRESTTLVKLVDVVKLGYAPDDEGGDGQAPTATVSSPGNAGGLAGALGCPPGVVCCVVS